MIVAGSYSFNSGEEKVLSQYPDLMPEVYKAIESVDASLYRTKVSKEQGRREGELLYSPIDMNKAFKSVIHIPVFILGIDV